jgi:hypothetical protein
MFWVPVTYQALEVLRERASQGSSPHGDRDRQGCGRKNVGEGKVGGSFWRSNPAPKIAQGCPRVCILPGNKSFQKA